MARYKFYIVLHCIVCSPKFTKFLENVGDHSQWKMFFFVYL